MRDRSLRTPDRSPLTRVLNIAALVVLALGASAIVVWYLAFEVGSRPPGSVRIEGLHDRADITWTAEGDARVRLGDDRDAARAVGAVHVLSRPWSLLLVRQAALGRLSEWYGRPGLPSDLHVHRLGIPAAARAAFGRLSPDAQEALRGYADGINGALSRRRVLLAPAIATMDLEPEPWEPWHALAVEHLIAWLAATVDARPFADDRDVAGFLDARTELGELLGLGGLDHGAAWTMSGQAPGIFVRQVYGTSGVPPLVAIQVDSPGGSRQALTWLGVPTAWAGRDEERSWAVLPSGHAVIDSGAVAAVPVYIPLRLRDGSRDVATRVGDGRQIVVGGTYRLTWQGLGPWSDLDAARNVASGLAADFRLVDGIAISTRHDRPGPARTYGGRTVEVDQVVLVSSAPESVELARSLALVTSLGPDEVFGDVRTAWAEAAAAAADARLRSEASPATLESETLAYMAGWNGSFEGASIGAVIFDAVLNGGESSAAFLAAVDDLRRRFGTERTEWRWERDGGMLRYPGWIDGGPFPDEVRLPARYAPVDMARSGHPTAPAWGSAAPWVNPPAPAAWEAFIEDRDGGLMLFRRPFVPFDRMLGRLSTDPDEHRLLSVPVRASLDGDTRLIPQS